MTANLTNNEQTVLNSITELCVYDYSAEVHEISDKTGMSMESIKGVVGSLVKKNAVVCESEFRGDRTFYDIFPINSDGQTLSNNEWN